MKNSPVHGRREKREIPDSLVDDNLELAESVYQSVPVDYDELVEALENSVVYPQQAAEKRFLGKSFFFPSFV